MATISIEEAQAQLPDLICGLAKGEELEITEGGQVVARIVGERPNSERRLGPGFARGMLTVVSDDDEHLADFAEYMP